MATIYTLGVTWSTYFTRPPGPGWTLNVRPLRMAYRAPAFFTDQMTRPGRAHLLHYATFDDVLTVDRLDGTTASIHEDVEIFYLTTHGDVPGGQYCVYLHTKNWQPTATGIGNGGPVVAVFDTCDLIDVNNPNWTADWTRPTIGSSLRLVLGFASPATIDDVTSYRGEGFAKELIAGTPIAEAWMRGVHGTAYAGTGNDRAVAIALGDDPADAQDTLDNASLASWPGPRTGPQIHLAWKFCH